MIYRGIIVLKLSYCLNIEALRHSYNLIRQYIQALKVKRHYLSMKTLKALKSGLKWLIRRVKNC